jgi:hypothetical protein
VVDRFTVRLTAGDGKGLTLRHPEAAVWDLLSRGYPFVKVVSMMAYIAGVDHPRAQALVRAAVADWERDGFLQAGLD